MIAGRAPLRAVCLAFFVAGILRAAALTAQETSQEPLQEVSVVGTRISGSRTAEALPITLLSSDEILATGAVSGDDLLRTIPAMGAVTFNPGNGQQTNNSARGDVASIDLRGAGIGDTLVLLNGRRMVSYPTSQSKGGVPLIAYNAQSLPVGFLDHLEVLRDGAGAIYGSDAVAGVVNAVTQTRFDGATIEYEHGAAQGTQLRQDTARIKAGDAFAEGAGHVSLALNWTQRAAEPSGDEPFTATDNLRPLFSAYPAYAASTAPDNRSTESSWPTLVALGTSLPIRQGSLALTTSAGAFHLQPTTLAGCLTGIGSGLCIGSGAVKSLHYDTAQNDFTTDSPAVHRGIGELNADYQISPALQAYGELDYYHSNSQGLTTQGTSLVPIGVPASNYYNPLGALLLPDGQANPNRVPNLTNVPKQGLPVSVASYRFNDLGPNPIDVDGDQSRVLLGVKGTLGSFEWDSGLLYGSAQVTDRTNSISSTLLARQLALSTPDAYNPFNGGCLNNAGGGDCTPSSTAALAAIQMPLKRVSTSSLTSADFKMSQSHWVFLPAGGVGLAFGLEARRETHQDTRAAAVDGSTPFTDPVTGQISASSATGVNSTPSTSGSRDIYSSFIELAVPLVSPAMGIPLIQSLDMQLAGRYEYYDEFGSVAKPKVAMNWGVFGGLKLRASFQQGFKAPNLETVDPFTYVRAQSVQDYYRCEADLRTHKISTFSACTRSVTIAYNESGNPSLKPETSSSYSFGFVLEPTFLPDSAGRLTLSVDRWQLKQTAVVGVIGVQNLSAQDYLSRLQGGAGSARVVRAAPTPDDIAAFAGSGLAPVGAIMQMNDQFQNLLPQTLSGVDGAVAWQSLAGRVGTIAVNLNASLLDKFYQAPSLAEQSLLLARAGGLINPATPLAITGDQLEKLDNPRIKASASLTWSLKGAQAGASLVYTGKTQDTALLSNTGVPWPVASLTVINLYGQFTFGHLPGIHDLRLRLGVRNLFNRMPPLESEGYNPALYVPYGRYLYGNVGVEF